MIEKHIYLDLIIVKNLKKVDYFYFYLYNFFIFICNFIPLKCPLKSQLKCPFTPFQNLLKCPSPKTGAEVKLEANLKKMCKLARTWDIF